MDKKTIKDINVKNKKIIIRVDYNVPMQNGVITDDTRIQKSLPTLQYLLSEGAAVIIMTHLGRPKGKKAPEFTVKPVAEYLGKILNKEIIFASDCIGEETESLAKNLKSGEILFLENLRFYKEEEENDLEFARQLASLAEVYVNDGFGVSHRAHSSVDAITLFLPSVSGFLLEKEIQFLGSAVNNPQRPFAAILGGAKVSDKIDVIASLLTKVNVLIIGGGMANTFLAAQGYNMQKSLVEEGKIELAKELLQRAEQSGVKLYLPIDVVAADKFAADANFENCSVGDIKPDYMALDIGSKTIDIFAKALEGMETIVWNGPMGVFEIDAFAHGTERIAETVANISAISIVGGGDSVAAIEKIGVADKITHISTGGGASLEYLEGKDLPGIVALDDLRTPLIAGNWKMNKTVREATVLAQEIVELTFGADPEVVIFPPFTALESVAEAIDGKHVGYGAQDLHWEDKGAFTGAVSGPMIAEIGCQYVLVGHSERRHVFGETNYIIADKMKAALRNDIIPILCVGELDEEHVNGQTQDVIAIQLKEALEGLDYDLLAHLVVAYEPVWAIGTGKTASVGEAEEVCSMIRNWLNNKIGETQARNIRILYGGSVNADNAADFMAVDDIDGVLVGGASIVAESFAKIVRYE